MDKILHDPKDPKLRELWYIPYYGSCRILSINRASFRFEVKGSLLRAKDLGAACDSGFLGNAGFGLQLLI